MSYKRSRSRVEYEGKSNDLLNLSKAISYKKNPLSYDHKNLIFQASIVLLCSCFEEYLRNFMEDLFFQYRTQCAKLAEIPANVRTYGLLIKQQEIYRNFLYKKEGEIQVINKLNVASNDTYSLLQDDIVYNGHIEAKAILSGKKYPKYDNLKVLYHRLGITDIFDKINCRGRKDYKMDLDAFLDVRTNIAHHESTTLTIDDVKRHFKNINDIISQLDRVSFSHCCSASGHKYWPAD